MFDQKRENLVTNKIFAGSVGVHTAISRDDRSAVEFFSKLGFIDLSPQLPEETQLLYMGRSI